MNINETCSCGASITGQTGSETFMLRAIQDWRNQHQHVNGRTEAIPEIDADEQAIAALAIQNVRFGAKQEQDRIIAHTLETYPADMFPAPDWDQVHTALASIGVTLDAVAGSLLRRMVPVLVEEDQK